MEQQFGLVLGGILAPASAIDGMNQGIWGLVEESVTAPTPAAPITIAISPSLSGQSWQRGSSTSADRSALAKNAASAWQDGPFADHVFSWLGAAEFWFFTEFRGYGADNQ